MRWRSDFTYDFAGHFWKIMVLLARPMHPDGSCVPDSVYDRMDLLYTLNLAGADLVLFIFTQQPLCD
jgi:hypothetical protein